MVARSCPLDAPGRPRDVLSQPPDPHLYLKAHHDSLPSRSCIGSILTPANFDLINTCNLRDGERIMILLR